MREGVSAHSSMSCELTLQLAVEKSVGIGGQPVEEIEIQCKPDIRLADRAKFRDILECAKQLARLSTDGSLQQGEPRCIVREPFGLTDPDQETDSRFGCEKTQFEMGHS